jgi:hypothetical protein
MPRGIAGTGVAREVSKTALKAWFGYKQPTPEQVRKFEEISAKAEGLAAAILTYSAPGEMQTRCIEELQIVVSSAQAAIVNSNGV